MKFILFSSFIRKRFIYVLEWTSKDWLQKKKKTEKIIEVGWKHRDSSNDNYIQMQKPVGGKRRLKLDTSVTYTLEDIKKLAIDLFKTNNRHMKIVKVT